mgnify:CR=1 FL=1
MNSEVLIRPATHILYWQHAWQRLEGLKEKKMPMPNVDKNIFEMTAAEKAAESIEELPLNLFDAVKELEADQYICDTLGKHASSNTSRQNTRNG